MIALLLESHLRNQWGRMCLIEHPVFGVSFTSGAETIAFFLFLSFFGCSDLGFIVFPDNNPWNASLVLLILSEFRVSIDATYHLQVAVLVKWIRRIIAVFPNGSGFTSQA